ncbi:hypothetical protein, partial [Dietzia cinnamea]|uniref:hypothetical protein n=1 Tax=Dietzia cinnamea TaxID=321318 RepID=UPI0021A5616C
RRSRPPSYTTLWGTTQTEIDDVEKPEDKGGKVDASALHAQAKRLSEQLTQELYGSQQAA